MFSKCVCTVCVCDQDQLHTFFSKSLHFFLALLEVKTEDLRRLLFLSNLLARLFTDGRSLNTTECTSDSASWDTPTTPDEWAELERNLYLTYFQHYCFSVHYTYTCDKNTNCCSIEKNTHRQTVCTYILHIEHVVWCIPVRCVRV